MENNRTHINQIQREHSRKERKKIKSLEWLKKKLEADDKPFKCKECTKKYANQGTLHRHKALHSNVKKFKCDLCGKAFRTDVSLNGHNVSHLEKTLKCDQCPLMFKGENRLKSHRNVHIGEKAYQCKSCLQAFTQKGSMKRHELMHSDLKEECDICNWKFHDKTHLKILKRKHIEGQIIRNWVAPQCKICSQSFTNIIGLREHMSLHDPDIVKKLNYRKCERCNMTFANLQRLNLHLSNHEKNARVINICCSYKKSLPHRCEECNVCFPTSTDFSKHMRSSEKHKRVIDPSSLKKNQLICDICNVKFSSHESLNMHKRVHTLKSHTTAPYVRRASLNQAH